VMASQLVLTGVLAETLARIYFESGNSRLYEVRNPQALAENDGWHKD